MRGIFESKGGKEEVMDVRGGRCNFFFLNMMTYEQSLFLCFSSLFLHFSPFNTSVFNSFLFFSSYLFCVFLFLFFDIFPLLPLLVLLLSMQIFFSSFMLFLSLSLYLYLAGGQACLRVLHLRLAQGQSLFGGSPSPPSRGTKLV